MILEKFRITGKTARVTGPQDRSAAVIANAPAQAGGISAERKSCFVRVLGERGKGHDLRETQD